MTTCDRLRDDLECPRPLAAVRADTSGVERVSGLLYVLAVVVAAIGEPRPVALIVAGAAAATETFAICRRL